DNSIPTTTAVAPPVSWPHSFLPFLRQQAVRSAPHQPPSFQVFARATTRQALLHECPVKTHRARFLPFLWHALVPAKSLRSSGAISDRSRAGAPPAIVPRPEGFGSSLVARQTKADRRRLH